MNEYCITLMTESEINLTVFSETADSARKELNDLLGIGREYCAIGG